MSTISCRATPSPRWRSSPTCWKRRCDGGRARRGGRHVPRARGRAAVAGRRRADPRGRSLSVAGVLLAAGEGRRFGGAKQLAPLRGRPLLEHALATMTAVCDPVVVVLGARAEDVRAGVDLAGAQAVVCDDWATGTFASLRCGLHAVGHDHDAVVVALA